MSSQDSGGQVDVPTSIRIPFVLLGSGGRETLAYSHAVHTAARQRELRQSYSSPWNRSCFNYKTSTVVPLYAGRCLLILGFSLSRGVSGAENYFPGPSGLDHADPEGREAFLPSDLAVAMQTCNGRDVCSGFAVNVWDPLLQRGMRVRSPAGVSCDASIF